MRQLDVFDLYCRGHYAEVERLVSEPGHNVFLWWLRGRMKLGRGDEDGWKDIAVARYPQGMEWAGEDLTGKVILIKQQEGLGDQIMYARFIPDLIARAKEVWMEPVKTIERLFCESFPGLHWGIPEKMDYRTGSGACQWAKPVAAPYLQTPGYKPVPSRTGRLRVGLTWRGNPEYQFDNNRSLLWEDFRPLLELERQYQDVDFFTLQCDHSQPTGFPNLAANCKDFADTARALQSLDLLITTCTAMPNLAGALGHPKVWLILRDPIDFRWGVPVRRADWYPDVRQFRNTSIEAVRDALSELIASQKCEPLSVASS